MLVCPEKRLPDWRTYSTAMVFFLGRFEEEVFTRVLTLPFLPDGLLDFFSTCLTFKWRNPLLHLPPLSVPDFDGQEATELSVRKGDLVVAQGELQDDWLLVAKQSHPSRAAL